MTSVRQDRGWQRFTGRIQELDELFSKVGILRDHGAQSPHPDAMITMVELALIHEFGSEEANIPARSFIRATLEERADQFERVAQLFVAQVVTGRITPQKCMDLLGGWAAGEVRRKMTHGAHIPPPLKKSTKKAKGSDRPLVDDAHLAGAVKHEVSR